MQVEGINTERLVPKSHIVDAFNEWMKDTCWQVPLVRWGDFHTEIAALFAEHWCNTQPRREAAQREADEAIADMMAMDPRLETMSPADLAEED